MCSGCKATKTVAAIKAAAKASVRPRAAHDACGGMPPQASILKRPASAIAGHGARPPPVTTHETAFFGGGKINVLPHQSSYRVFKHLPVKHIPSTRVDLLVRWGKHGGFAAAREYALDVIQNAPPLFTEVADVPKPQAAKTVEPKAKAAKTVMKKPSARR